MAEDHHEHDDTPVPGGQWQHLMIGILIVTAMCAAVINLPRIM